MINTYICTITNFVLQYSRIDKTEKLYRRCPVLWNIVPEIKLNITLHNKRRNITINNVNIITILEFSQGNIVKI